MTLPLLLWGYFSGSQYLCLSYSVSPPSGQLPVCISQLFLQHYCRRKFRHLLPLSFVCKLTHPHKGKCLGLLVSKRKTAFLRTICYLSSVIYSMSFSVSDFSSTFSLSVADLKPDSFYEIYLNKLSSNRYFSSPSLAAKLILALRGDSTLFSFLFHSLLIVVKMLSHILRQAICHKHNNALT